jgi:cyclophilin family peptidyl-prolyl cis-trans isomerase
MEANPKAFDVLSRVGRRYYLVLFYRSYKQKQIQAGDVTGKPSKVRAEFIANMFPADQKREKYAKRNRRDPVRSFNHQMYVARRLSDLVTHFGCGVLLYPGFDMTISE